MLTKEELEGLKRMSREDLGKLLGLIREARAMFTVGGCMPQSALDDLVRRVPTSLCQEIVQDLRTVPDRGGFLPAPKARPEEALRPAEPKDERPSYLKEGGRGWIEPVALDVPSGVKWCDQQMDTQDELDRRDLQRRFRRV